MSPDPTKCKIIKDWPAPESNAEVKSFLQTIQFNAKFLGGEVGELSYPELTEPLRALTKKYARFIWGEKESAAFNELKRRLCSEKVIAPYDNECRTRLHVDSSPVGTQATVAQLHNSKDGNEVWRPVNHTSRSWTPPEAGYGQIERESNGILTGMYMNKMYTLGTKVQVVTDHQPLLKVYNSPEKPKQLRVDRHRIKLLPFEYEVLLEPGRNTPCDYGSRHPPKRTDFTKEEVEQWCIETGDDIYVNRVIEDNLPCAITLSMLKDETANDKELNMLMRQIPMYDICQDKDLKEYKGVYSELWSTDGVLMKGNQVVIPKSIRANVISLAHEGHQGVEKTLKLMRQSCWFPKMHENVSTYVASCLPCCAALPNTPPVPLQPNVLPDRAWEKLHADFKGPIGGQYYLHVVIDQYSKYPEVDVLKSTSFKKLRPVLDRIFSGHGIPETVTCDNGPPYSGYEMGRYAQEMGFELTPVSPEDPQGNGFAENFVKLLCKLLHTAAAEKKDPRVELHKYLLQYRATPHSTTGKSPAEMLFNRKIKTKLPQYFIKAENKERKEICMAHDLKKSKQKEYFDKRQRVQFKDIKPGDEVLIKQKKTTIKPPFNPHP